MQKIIFMPLRKKIFVLLVLIGGAFTTSFIRQIPKQKETDLAKEANRMMWNSLHLGNYDSIPELLQKLNKAYSENSNDFKIVAHLGFVHLWAFSERGRKAADPTIIDHIYLSNQYLKEAIKLNPDDPRLRGFQSSTEIAQGVISQKYNLVLKGYINSLKAINKWHIFNMSALSLIESQLDSGSVLYKQGIKYQWKVIDECSCKKLDEETIMASPQKVLTDFINEVNNSPDPLIKRACSNSWIAPHNLEGFCLNFGDMLVKKGRTAEAKEIYEAAKLAPSYKEWVYRTVLENRLQNLESNRIIFNKPLEIIYTPNEKQIFINSRISCVACHQMSEKEFIAAGYQEPTDDIYFIKNN